MYSIDALFRPDTPDGARAGSDGAWRLEKDDDVSWLWHHGTLMLSWSVIDGQVHIWSASLGWGSVSDQGGMNRAFRALGAPFHYDRDERGGGPRIVTQPWDVRPVVLDSGSTWAVWPVWHGGAA